MHIDAPDALNNDSLIQVQNGLYNQFEPDINNISHMYFNKLNNNIKIVLIPYLNSEGDFNNNLEMSQVIKDIIEYLINSNNITIISYKNILFGN